MGGRWDGGLLGWGASGMGAAEVGIAGMEGAAPAEVYWAGHTEILSSDFRPKRDQAGRAKGLRQPLPS